MPVPADAAVIPIDRLDRESIALAGGKGANLGELSRAGSPVPTGFVVTTTAYAKTLQHNTIADRLDHKSSPTQLRNLVTAATVPADIRQAIVAAYRELGSCPVAVRSSGTSEDLPDAAFAGQHDTFLNIIGEESVITAVQQCWSSLWTDRAIQYRHDRGIDADDITIAVVIQKMVQSDAAGVMFTANPISGDRQETVIDAGLGLGESVVSGMVTPDHYVVKTRSGKIIESRRGNQEVVIKSDVAGGTVQSAGVASEDPVLETTILRRLVGLGRDIQHHFGQAQDVEWSLADGQLYIVQARPITAMPSPLKPVTSRQRMALSIIGELFPHRPYPLDVSAWIEPCLAGVRSFFSHMGIKFPASSSFLITDHGVVSHMDPPNPEIGWATPLTLLRHAIQDDRYSRETLESDPRLIAYLAQTNTALHMDLTKPSYGDLKPLLEHRMTLFASIMQLRNRFLARAAAAMVRCRITLALIGSSRDASVLIGGIDTKTAETNRNLVTFADRVRNDPELNAVFKTHAPQQLELALQESRAGREFHDEFMQFLEQYGHRESVMLSIRLPTWCDQPSIPLGLIQSMANEPSSITDSDSPSKRAEQRLFDRPGLRRGPLRKLVARQLAAARGFTQFREDTHFYATRGHPLVRRVLIEYSRRLTKLGALAVNDDIFYLHHEEFATSAQPSAKDAARLRKLVAQRKTVWKSLEGKPLIDRRYFKRKAKRNNALLQGTSGSSGSVTAKVRIIAGPEEFSQFKAGEILVAPFTNPSWTPLFERAAAVVVDTGAAMSHAAIVAREYGIPAVMGTIDASTALNDGQLITVDGDSGAIYEGVPAEQSLTAVHNSIGRGQPTSR